MIPKKIHYCWFGGNPLPKYAKKYIASWEKYCPDFEIVQWDETNFDLNCHPFVQRAYETGNWAFVSDFARLKIIYENGGIYLDTDVEILKNFDAIMEDECYVGVQQIGHFIATGLGFGAVPYHPMIKAMLKQYDNVMFDEQNKNNFACPYLNTKAFCEFGFSYKDEIQTIGGAKIYPPKYFDPIASGSMENLTCNDTFSIHHYSASWAPILQRLKRKIAIVIGEDRILRMKELLK